MMMIMRLMITRHDHDDNDNEADDSGANNSVNNVFPNLNEKTISNLVIVDEIRKDILNNNSEITALINEAENSPKDDFLLKLDKYKKSNKLNYNILDYIWQVVYRKNKVNNVINSIDIDKKEDAKGYANKYKNIVKDKISLVNVLELTDELMGDSDQFTYNDTTKSKIKVFNNNLVKRIETFNSLIRYETKKKYTENNTKPDSENNTEPVTKIDVKKKNTKPDINSATSDDIKAHLTDKQKLIKKRYKSLLETKKTIKNNIDSVCDTLKKLPKESQSKLIELIRLDTLLNDSINVIWREIYER